MWKVYMYANNLYIKKIKVKNVEQLFNTSYVINVWFKKHIFNTNYTKVVVKPKLLKKTIENNIFTLTFQKDTKFLSMMSQFV